MLENIIVTLCVLLFASEIHTTQDPNIVLDFIGLVEQYDGYTAEEYEVRTDDGYILKLHRISGSPSSPKAPGKPAVLLQHGLLSSSDFHVVLGPEQALTFYLADEGYDVWLGNVRGNTYSKRHIKYSHKGNNKIFWNFSMHEMGAVDVPKFIDTVLEKTNRTQLTYIGYSMGATLSYILLSTRPEYNDKINLVINIAPSVYFSPPRSALLDTFLAIAKPAKAALLAERIYEFFPKSKLFEIARDICGTELGKVFCASLLSPVLNVENFNTTVFPIVLNYVPAGTSLNTVDHYYQIIKSEKFQRYINSEVLENQSFCIPSYDLYKVTAKHLLFYSDNDVFYNVRDIMKLKSMLKNVVAVEKVPAEGFNHVDFMWAVNAKKLIYDRLIEYMKQFA